MFSTRIPQNLAPNRLARALDRARVDGRRLLDLTQSNPTDAGFDYPPDLFEPLADQRALKYAPHALGLLEARAAVSSEYQRRGLSIPPARIVLTASTSEAYALLFKMLCDPGDEVLVPRPGYPLFEHLTRLETVVAVPYDLDHHGKWSVDLSSVERGLSSPRVRAVLIVSPNNPTGSFIKQDELDRLASLCGPRDVPIIADEVFADYELEEGAANESGHVLARTDVLSFGLGGLSKSAGLPQVKLAWIATAGPEPVVKSALSRLELACDTYLSVSTPVQLAARALMACGAGVRQQIQSRISLNYQYLVGQATRVPSCRILNAEGGWYAVLRVPSLEPEEDLVVSLLTVDGVLVHPGYFFDFPRESYLVASLLAAERDFQDGVTRILNRFAAAVSA